MHSILIYGFPLILVGFEWGLRHLLKTDSIGFIGPTLAAAALTILVPLTRPKKTGLRSGSSKNVVVNAYDQQLIPFIWLVVLASLFAWSAACYYSLQQTSIAAISMPTHIAIGLICYFVSLLLVAVKEAI